MKRLLFIAGLVVSLTACDTTGAGTVDAIPGAAPVCTAIQSDKFDLALKAYGAAVDAVNLLIDAKVLVPGSAKAVAVADANDKVLAAFSVAEHARQVCDSNSYAAAILQVQAGIADVRAALK